jgi:hypothetical protein
MINETQFEEWYEGDVKAFHCDDYKRAKRAWYEASELQQNKIDELQTAFNDFWLIQHG